MNIRLFNKINFLTNSNFNSITINNKINKTYNFS